MMFIHSTTMTLFQPVLDHTTYIRPAKTQNSAPKSRGSTDRPVEIVDSPNAVDFPIPLKKGVELKNVSYAYQHHQASRRTEAIPTYRQAAAEPVIKDVSFCACRNLALHRGGVRAGKTTLRISSQDSTSRPMGKSPSMESTSRKSRWSRSVCRRHRPQKRKSSRDR